MTGSPALEVTGLTLRFGPVVAVDTVSFAVAAGGALALVGRNGAGKSTTLRVIAGVLPPTSGTVTIAGVDMVRDPSAGKQLVGYCPDVGGLIPRATPWEHLQLAATLRQLPGDWRTHAEELLDRFDLTAATDRITAGFSHGMGRRLSVVLAAFHRPKVLLLDEPFDGVDPLGVDATLELLRDLRAEGTAVVVSTHQLDLATESCDGALVLRRGAVAAATSAADLVGRAGAARYRELLT